MKKNLHLKVNGSLWIECGSKKYFGPGPMELLERIESTGSISKAAKQMGMSYKKSWDIINRLNKKVVEPLVETRTGGKKGGGSFISTEAKQLIVQYKDLRKNFELFLEKQTKLLL
ncbi:MAG TPA: LysR family transcriptional regulator [Puia sp.]|nr:LysR family transcriptional regulator [Puia sp.]